MAKMKLMVCEDLLSNPKNGAQTKGWLATSEPNGISVHECNSYLIDIITITCDIKRKCS